MLPRLLKQLAAVVLGSLLYFFVLMPHLPPAARHEPFRLDWGLIVDAWLCLVVYGLIELSPRLRKRSPSELQLPATSYTATHKKIGEPLGSPVRSSSSAVRLTTASGCFP